MKNRLLPLALSALAALVGVEPAAAQKSYGGKARYAQGGKGIHITKPTSFAKPLHVQKPSYGYSNHAATQSGFGFGFSKPGLSVTIGNGFGNLSTCAPAPVWIPGRWTTVRERTWIPATTSQVWVPPVYATQFDPCGKPYQVMTQAGYYDTVCVPGHFDVQPVKKWIPGHWK